MESIRTALIWITDLLNEFKIPYQITGGTAARAYGSTRPIEDIDIDIPDDRFLPLQQAVSKHIVYGPERFKDDKWDLLLMTLDYHGQKIDISGAFSAKIFDPKTKRWVMMNSDLSKIHLQDFFDRALPFIPIDNLIEYKTMLARQEDLIDMYEIEKSVVKD